MGVRPERIPMDSKHLPGIQLRLALTDTFGVRAGRFDLPIGYACVSRRLPFS